MNANGPIVDQTVKRLKRENTQHQLTKHCLHHDQKLKSQQDKQTKCSGSVGSVVPLVTPTVVFMLNMLMVISDADNSFNLFSTLLFVYNY